MTKFEKIEKFVRENVAKTTGSEKEIYEVLEAAHEKFKCFIYFDFANDHTKKFVGMHHFKVFNTRNGEPTSYIDFFNIKAK